MNSQEPKEKNYLVYMLFLYAQLLAIKAKTHEINTQLYKLKDEIKKLITN
ncbi:hypothetical protein ACE6H2_011343 [Prunus campanulata]